MCSWVATLPVASYASSHTSCHLCYILYASIRSGFGEVEPDQWLHVAEIFAGSRVLSEGCKMFNLRARAIDAAQMHTGLLTPIKFLLSFLANTTTRFNTLGNSISSAPEDFSPRLRSCLVCRLYGSHTRLLISTADITLLQSSKQLSYDTSSRMELPGSAFPALRGCSCIRA